MSAALLEAAVLVLLLVTATVAVLLGDVLAAAVAFSGYSLALSLLWVLFGAPDVALTEAAVGAGVVTVLFLTTIAKTSRPAIPAAYTIRWPEILLVTGFALALAATLPSLPPVGATSSPAHDHLGAYYLDRAPTETGIANIVTAILGGYRAYDTFGEIVVVFIAGIAALLLLRREGITIQSIFTSDQMTKSEGTDPSPIAQTAIRLVVPFVALFGLYVTFQGAKTPGGGFQGGVVAAAAVILLGLAIGVENTRRWLDHRAVVGITVGGIVLFSAIGIGTIALGGSFLEYDVIPLENATLYSIELIEVGIGATVTGIVLVFFFGLVPGAARSTEAGEPGEKDTTFDLSGDSR